MNGVISTAIAFSVLTSTVPYNVFAEGVIEEFRLAIPLSTDNSYTVGYNPVKALSESGSDVVLKYLANEGVQVTVKPAEGYSLEATVVEEDGDTVPSTYNDEDGTVSFVMPDNDSELRVVTSKKSSGTVKMVTNTVDSTTGGKFSKADDNVELKTTVTLAGLTKGSEYSLRSYLVDKDTGKAYQDDKGKDVVDVDKFVASKDSDKKGVSLKFAPNKSNADIIYCVDLIDSKNNVIASVNATTKDESSNIIHLRKLLATLVCNAEGVDTNGKTKITAKLNYTGLEAGSTYTVSGKLMDAKEGIPLMEGTTDIISTSNFKADSFNGLVTLEFNVDTSKVANKDLAVYAKLLSGSEVIATYEDSKNLVKMGEPVVDNSKAKITSSLDKSAIPSTGVTEITDTVSYSGLVPGKSYTLKGSLKSTGEVVESVPFVPEKAEGTVSVKFKIDDKFDRSKPVNVYERLYYGSESYVIAESTSEVKVTNISTESVCKDTNSKMCSGNDMVNIENTVSYGKTLESGKEYTLKSVVKNSSGGSVASAEETFKADESGKKKLNYSFNSTELAGQILSVETDLYEGANKVASYTEKNAIRVVELDSTLVDSRTMSPQGNVSKEAKYLGTVMLSNLVSDEKCKVKGVLCDASNGDPIKVNGKEVSAEETFTSGNDSEIELEYNFDSTGLVGNTVIQKIYFYSRTGENSDYKEIMKSVGTDAVESVATLSTKYSAVDSTTNSQKMTLGEKVGLTYTLTYEGLIPGNQYLLKAAVVDKSTGKSIGTGATESKTFTPDNSSGSIKLYFSINTNNLKGKTLAVISELYEGTNKVDESKDLSNSAVCVVVPESATSGTTSTTSTTTTSGTGKTTDGGGKTTETKTTGALPKTGDNMSLVYGGVASLGIGGLLLALLRRRKKKLVGNTVEGNESTDSTDDGWGGLFK